MIKVDDAKSAKIEVACGKLVLHMDFDKDNNPIGFYINSGKHGICKASSEAIGRLVFLCLQHNLINEVIDQLNLIICPSCKEKKGELPKPDRIKFPNSCAEAVARFLKKLQDDGVLKKEVSNPTIEVVKRVKYVSENEDKELKK